MTVFGFGATEEDGTSSNVLLETGVFYLTPFLCSASYPEFFINPDVMMCANADDTDRYVFSYKISERTQCGTLTNWILITFSCTGDSGGPLITQDGIQVGITSWVSICFEKFDLCSHQSTDAY
jgi:secreted trypsin-like serine protease